MFYTIIILINLKSLVTIVTEPKKCYTVRQGRVSAVSGTTYSQQGNFYLSYHTVVSEIQLVHYT